MVHCSCGGDNTGMACERPGKLEIVSRHLQQSLPEEVAISMQDKHTPRGHSRNGPLRKIYQTMIISQGARHVSPRPFAMRDIL